MTRETQLWSWLKKARLYYRMALHMNRVENSIGTGMPDVEGCLENAKSFWIELKVSERPKRPTTNVKVKFQVNQPEWLKRRWRLSGTAWLLVQVGSGSEARRYLIQGGLAQDVKDGVPEKYLQIMDVLKDEKSITPAIIIAKASRK